MLIETDARGQVDEFPAEDNNRTAAAIAIDANPVPPPDLVAQSINGPGDAFDDSSFTVRYKVGNFGAGITDPGAWSDQIWLTLGLDGPKPARGDRLIGTNFHSGALEVGESYEAETTVRIPKGLSGQYFLTVYADGGRRVYEAAFAENVNPNAANDLEGSNYSSTPINILLTPPADLQVTDVQADANGDGRSRGSRCLGRSPTMVPPPPIGKAGRTPSTSLTMPSIQRTTSLSFALPHSGALQPGESYELSADFTLPPTAKGSHVLVRTNVDPRIALTEEQKFLAEVRAVLERIEQAAGSPIGEIAISDLQQFSQSELRAILAGPTGVIATVYEGPFTENNVAAAESVIVDALADLAVIDVTADPSSQSGESISVSWTVENQGDFATATETDSINQYIFLSQDAVFSADRAMLVKTQPFVLSDPLQPGESYTDTAEVATPPGSSGNVVRARVYQCQYSPWFAGLQRLGQGRISELGRVLRHTDLGRWR